MRKYAGFWSWPDRRRRELAIVEDLLQAMSLRGAQLYESPACALQDPPDCVLRAADGSVVAMEVTELACEEAVRRNQKGDRVYRDWQPNEVVEEVAARLREKDTKTFRGGPYSKISAIIHTDEPVIGYDSYREILSSTSFGSFVQISEAYLLFSYDPAHQYCPYVLLSLSRDPHVNLRAQIRCPTTACTRRRGRRVTTVLGRSYRCAPAGGDAERRWAD